MKNKFLYFVIATFSISAWAYIPKTQYILQRTSALHGSGIYLIDQDITFHSPKYGTLQLKEQWLIEGGEKMRVRIYGTDSETNNDILFTYLYDKNRRLSVDPQGIVRSSRVSDEFFEPAFHFRTADFMKKFLHRLGILPVQGLGEPPRFHKVENIKYEPEIFTRLSRFGGTLNYAIGPAPTVNQTAPPAVWIEQDQFHIRRLKTAPNIDVVASKYQRYHNNLWLAQVREIKWDDHRAIIHVTSVKNYDRNSQIRQRLSESSFNPQKEPSLVAKLPENPLIVDFYRRFR